MNISSFPFLFPFTEKPKPCVAWSLQRLCVCQETPSQPGQRFVCSPGCVRHWQAVTDQHLGHHHFISLGKGFQKAKTQPCMGLCVMKVCSHTWQKRWWWRRHSRLKTSAEWCLWYPPTVQGKCLLCKHTREISLQTLCTHRVHKIYLYFHTQKENLDINVLQQLSSMLYVASHVTQQKTMM